MRELEEEYTDIKSIRHKAEHIVTENADKEKIIEEIFMILVGTDEWR